MKTVSYDGVAAVTADEVADALLDLALVVARYSRYERVAIPVVVEGRREELALMLGPTIHLSTLTSTLDETIEIAGAAAAAAELRNRAMDLTAPPALAGAPPDR